MKRFLVNLIIILPLVPFLCFGQTSKGISKTNPGTSSSGPRTALVIGNARYTTAPLRNPVNDARAISSTLKELGFQVTLLEDAGQKKMKRAIDKFGRTIRDGGVGLFYFSGHGMQVDGRNYLIPVDAEVDAEADVEYEAVEAGRVLAKIKTANNGMNLVILDACRNNPFTRSFRSASKGLATLNAPSGTFIAYATSPGSVASDGKGDNGLYTGELIKHMKTPGLKVEEVFKRVRANVQKKSKNKQVPWDASSLTGDFFFQPATASVAAIPNVDAPPETSGLQLDTLIQQAETQEKAKQELERIQRDWSEWQARMQTDFEQAESFEQRNVTPGLKIEPWRQFITAYGANNPFTDSDEQLRVRAQKRLEYWRQETQRRAEAQKQKQSTVSIEPETASVTQQQASPPPQAPADPKAEKLWKRYQLALKRNLPSVKRKAAEKLIEKYPNSDYSIFLIAEKIRGKIKDKKLTNYLSEVIEKFRQQHPNHPETKKLLNSAIPKLLARADDKRASNRFESAEKDYRLAEVWGADHGSVKKGIKAIRLSRRNAALNSGDRYVKSGEFEMALRSYNEAERLGANPDLISSRKHNLKASEAEYLINNGQVEKAENLLLDWEMLGYKGPELETLRKALAKKRIELLEYKARQLIQNGKIDEAEKFLVDWELSEEESEPNPKLYNYLDEAKHKKKWEPVRQRIISMIKVKNFSEARETIKKLKNSAEKPRDLQNLSIMLTNAEQKEKQRLIAKKQEMEWKRITILIKRKNFEQALQAINHWKSSENPPNNLNDLLILLEKTEKKEHLRISTRLKKFKELITSDRFMLAEKVLNNWFKEGGDAVNRLKMVTFFNQHAPYWIEPQTGISFRKIPNGRFQIGDPFNEGDEDEKTGWFYDDVTIQSFLMGTREITEFQWKTVMGKNHFRDYKGDDFPMTMVSWQIIQQFINKLNIISGMRFRLPTEAEWEFACTEGGKKVRFCNGKNTPLKSQIHYGKKQPAPVASYAANSLGLYDMSGNVMEWTCSEYKNPYDGSEKICADQASRYTLRGGSYLSETKYVRSYGRFYYGNVDYSDTNLGFRLAMDLP